MTETILSLTPDDIAQVDRLWSERPRRPKMPGLTPLRPGTPTITITCRACGMRAPVEVSAPAKLCRECCADLVATAAHVHAQLAAAEASIAQHHEQWITRLAGLDDALAARYSQVQTDRTRAETALERARQGKWSTATDGQTITAAVALRRAERDAILARIEKTKRNPANPLATLLHEEAAWQTELARLHEVIARWSVAVQEVEVARDALPF